MKASEANTIIIVTTWKSKNRGHGRKNMRERYQRSCS